MTKSKGSYGYSKYKGTCKMYAVRPKFMFNQFHQRQQVQQPRLNVDIIFVRENNKVWHLARLFVCGSDVVASKGEGVWEYQKKDGEIGIFPFVGIAQVIRSAEGVVGQKKLGSDLKALFKKKCEANGQGAANEQQYKGANGGSTKGRIPQRKHNTRYVAFTRAVKKLYVLKSTDKKKQAYSNKKIKKNQIATGIIKQSFQR